MSQRPTTARFTHIALPCHDVQASIDWYQRYTPLRELDRRSDSEGHSAWLGQPDMVDKPFIVVLVSFDKDHAKGPRPTMAPFAHLGIEVPEHDDIDRIAARGREEGCLLWEPQQLPAPVGYVCALRDPDGNVVEFSFDQGVFAKVQEVWAPD